MAVDAEHRIDGPPASLGGPGLAAAIRRGFLATRPPFYIASVMPVVVGTAWAGTAFHHFDARLFALGLLVTVLVHGAGNVFNDVGDDATGVDQGNTGLIYPYTGGSRFIQAGLMSRGQMLRLAIGLTAVAVVLGGVLVALRGPQVLLFGLAGIALAVLYSLPGVQLSGRGWGEASIGLAFGVVPGIGSAWLQSGVIDSGAVLLCLPVSAWAAALLTINGVPDKVSDQRAGKHTLVVRFGVAGARAIYQGLTVLALVASLAAIAARVLPAWYAVPALAIAALGFKAAAGIREPLARRLLKRSIELTILVHAAGSIALLAAILLRTAV